MWAYSNQQVNPLSSAGAAGRIDQPVGRVLRRLNPWQWLRRWAERETAANELYRLDDRTLVDLGITRGDFPAILSGDYRRGQ